MTTVFGDYQITVVSSWPWLLLSFTNTFHCCFRLEFGQWQAWSNCSVSHIMRPNCVPGQNFEAKGVFLHLPTLWSRFLLPYTLLSLLPSPSQERTWAPILHSSRGEPLTDSPFTLLAKPLLWLFSREVMSDSLWPHGLQHARLLCPQPSPGACSNSCLLGQWYYLTILTSVVPLSFCLQSFPASGSSSNEYSGLISFLAMMTA